MNAHALLTSQGWRGDGHTLHPTSDSTGLTQRLLISQKQNNLGVGKKQHHTSDQWWLKAFDTSLKGLDTSKEGRVVQTVTNGGLNMVRKGGGKFVGNGGLYAVFVKGQGLEGTIERTIVEEKTVEKISVETKEERRARKAARRAARAARAAAEVENDSNSTPNETVDEGTEEVPETKEQRRERRRLKRSQKEAEQETQIEDIPTVKTKKKKRRKD